MQQAVDDGLAKTSPLVYLQDRVNMRHNRHQDHGTQSWGIDDAVRLWPVSDPGNLNARRVEVGLDPLDDDTVATAWTVEQLQEHGRMLSAR